MSVSIAKELGYQNVLYITEPSLSIPHEIPDLNIVKLSYSKFRKKRNSVKSTLESARKLVDGIDNSYFIIADEFTNVKNIDSQTTQVWLAIRHLLSTNPLLMMSGTIRTTYNRDLIPIIFSMSMYAQAMSFSDLLKHVRNMSDRYTAKVPIPHVHKHATKFKDQNTDELKKRTEQYLVEVRTTRNKPITLYERQVEIAMPQTMFNFLRKLRKQNGYALNDGTFVRYVGDSSLRRLCDGHIEILDPNYSAYEPVMVRNSTDDRKVECIRAIAERHSESKIIILTSYTDSIEHLADRLCGGNYEGITVQGSSTPENTHRLIDNFKSSNCKFLIGTVQKLSTGHDIDEADVIIYHSAPSAYKDLEQAYGRIDRKTTTRNKYYYWLYYDIYEKEKVIARLSTVEDSMINWGFGKESFVQEKYKFENNKLRKIK
jgi:hypothetical protein